jgi:hypothetical protein
MKELLGDVDEDLADFVLEQVRERKSPDDVVNGLEPVRITFYHALSPPFLSEPLTCASIDR